MLNIFKFLKNSKGAVCLIVILLIIQAYCDLALPSYTSDILNIGLQQDGIEDGVLDTVRTSSLNKLEIFMSDSDAKYINKVYDYKQDTSSEDKVLKLKDKADRKKVNKILSKPEAIVLQMEKAGKETKGVIEKLEAGLKSGQITKEQIQQQMKEKMKSASKVTSTYLNQVATKYVKAEYEAQGKNVDDIQSSYLWKVGLKMILISAVMLGAAIITGLLASQVSSKVGRDLRGKLYSKVMSFTNVEMDKFSTASLITRSTNDIQQIQMVLVMLLRMVMYAPILGIGGIIKVLSAHTQMGWIIVLAVCVLGALVGILMVIAMPKFKKMQILVDRLNLVSRELLTGIMPIRAFSREDYEEKRFDKANTDLYKTQLFTNRTMAFMVPIMMFVMNGVSVLIVWVGGHKINTGTIQIGDLTAFITYSMVIVMGFLMLAMISIILPRAGVAADRIVEVLDTDIVIRDKETTVTIDKNSSKGEVRFNHVSFKYPNADENVLCDINFSAKSGETTAIIGATGSGKSTIINLIPRFFDVTDGQITIDNVDIRDMSQHNLRDLIGYVPQKGVLFSGDIMSNLKYGGDEISDDDAVMAANVAQAKEFIDLKSEGFNFAIAQGGSNVSGGQKQRLSIARAIAKKPKLYLFDDSFSALDYKTDSILRKELSKYTKDATVIIVAQRISTIMNAEKIIVLDEGKIVGTGKHSDLLKTCDVYKEIASSQLSQKELDKGGR